jgi:hypothetical protein
VILFSLTDVGLILWFLTLKTRHEIAQGSAKLVSSHDPTRCRRAETEIRLVSFDLASDARISDRPLRGNVETFLHL